MPWQLALCDQNCLAQKKLPLLLFEAASLAG
jgi:hypothetical protein